MRNCVDVLAVMDRLSYALQDRAGIVVEINAARAAVAELIGAADGVDATHGPMLNPEAVTPRQQQLCLDRLRAALARVGGAV